MRKPTIQDIADVLTDINMHMDNNQARAIADKILSLFEDEPTKPLGPKWTADLIALLSEYHINPCSNCGLDLSSFIRSKLKEFAEEIRNQCNQRLVITSKGVARALIDEVSKDWGLE